MILLIEVVSCTVIQATSCFSEKNPPSAEHIVSDPDGPDGSFVVIVGKGVHPHFARFISDIDLMERYLGQAIDFGGFSGYWWNFPFIRVFWITQSIQARTLINSPKCVPQLHRFLVEKQSWNRVFMALFEKLSAQPSRNCNDTNFTSCRFDSLLCPFKPPQSRRKLQQTVFGSPLMSS
jgi:hypothetical protein